MSFNKLKIGAFVLGISMSLCACGTPSPEVTDPPQKQALAIKNQGGSYKIGNPYKILGRWYYPKEDYSYSEIGTASWYGPDFHAKRTANGEKYNMHSLTAAHRTLPLPSIVRVTNLENGRSLIVRVNDRGPYARNRIIDVSKKVAQLLGFMEKGTAKVKVEIMEKESKNLKAALLGEGTISEVTAAPSTEIVRSEIGEKVTPVVSAQNAQKSALQTKAKTSLSKGYYVQAGAFASYDAAERLAEKLEGFGQTHVLQAEVDGRTFYRVRVGPTDYREEAIVLQSQIRDYGIPAAHVVEE